MTEVNLINVFKVYEGQSVPAVADVSLEIEAGRLTALLGPSGCGKTTIMKMIAGILRPTTGDIRFDGRSVLHIPAERRSAVMVFQKHLLFPYMNVLENVGFGLKMHGMEGAEIARRVGGILDLVHLPGFEDRRPHELSGGQQQRVALARALVVEPSVLLLDEPLSNLDAHLRDEMRELIANVQRETGITTILVTHDQEEAVVLSHKIALMFAGRVHQYDTPQAYYQRPASTEVARFFGARNFILATIHKGAADTPIGPLRLEHALACEGPATLTIRPEAVMFGEGETNSVTAQVDALVYLGTHVRCKFSVGDHQFEALATAEASANVREGEQVSLTFPPRSLWAMPVESR